MAKNPVRRKNVIIFLSEAAPQELYLSRITRFFQSDWVEWSFGAATDDELAEITALSGGRWDLLITDRQKLSASLATLTQFVLNNPGAVVGIISEASSTSATSLPGAVSIPVPSDLDEWLRMMHGLIQGQSQATP
jgi:hypothetical protein